VITRGYGITGGGGLGGTVFVDGIDVELEGDIEAELEADLIAVVEDEISAEVDD
jgi:hypothetical protein